MSQVSGTASVYINGDLVDTFQGVTVNPGGYARTLVETSSRTHFSKKRVSSKVDFEASYKKGDAIRDLDVEDAVIQVRFDTGQAFIIKNGFRVGPPDISEDGKVKYAFQGDPAEEVL